MYVQFEIELLSGHTVFLQPGCAGSPRFFSAAESAGGEPAWPDCAAFSL